VKQRRGLAVGGLGVAALVIVTAAQGWACVFGPSVFLSPANVKAGEAVQVEGLYFRPDVPVVARFNALDGPILAELGVPAGDRRMVTGPVTVPAGTPPGNYVLVFTQPGPTGAPVQVPARALLTVVGEGGTAPVLAPGVGEAGDERASGLVAGDAAVGADTLLLIGVGAAGVGMLLAGMAAYVAGRRAPAARPEKVRA
jgi:hypothetical protein